MYGLKLVKYWQAVHLSSRRVHMWHRCPRFLSPSSDALWHSAFLLLLGCFIWTDLKHNFLLRADKGTQKKQDIKITGASTLAGDEVDRMVKDAEQYADEDKKRREAVDTKNQVCPLPLISPNTLEPNTPLARLRMHWWNFQDQGRTHGDHCKASAVSAFGADLPADSSAAVAVQTLMQQMRCASDIHCVRVLACSWQACLPAGREQDGVNRGSPSPVCVAAGRQPGLPDGEAAEGAGRQGAR